MTDLDRLERGLREHLPQPLPEGATARVVAGVRARLEDGRRPRSPLPVLAGVASGAVLAAVLGGALWSRSAGPAGAARPAVTPPDRPVPGIALPAAARSGFTVEDVAFGDDLHGWEVGTLCPAARACALEARATADGGRSWSSPTPVTTGAAAPGGSARIAFTGDHTGFVADHGLHATHDGGRSWSDTGLPGDVVAVAPVGASVWALEGCAAVPPCAVRLVVSADGGHSWAPAAAQPPLAGPAAEMVRVSATDAFLAGAAASAPGGSRLVATHDGGRSWEALADPCASGRLDDLPALAALEPTEVWVACAATAEPAGRAILRSRDGGGHWELLAGVPDLEGSPSGLALAPRGPVYLTLGDGRLLRSADGVTWSTALDAGGDGRIRRVEFVDTSHGWVVTTAGRVLGTSDGGRTWTAPAP